MLEAILTWGDASQSINYIALSADDPPSTYLHQRINRAISMGVIAPKSRIIRDLSEAPYGCNVVMMINVCHEISLPQLPILLAQLLTQHVSGDTNGKLIIHEVETLSIGESYFIIWTPKDYEIIFNEIPGLYVTSIRNDISAGVPLDTTIIARDNSRNVPENLEKILVDRFQQSLITKKIDNLVEIQQLSPPNRQKPKDLKEALRQRRIVFLSAQVTNISLTELRMAQKAV